MAGLRGLGLPRPLDPPYNFLTGFPPPGNAQQPKQARAQQGQSTRFGHSRHVQVDVSRPIHAQRVCQAGRRRGKDEIRQGGRRSNPPYPAAGLMSSYVPTAVGSVPKLRLVPGAMFSPLPEYVPIDSRSAPGVAKLTSAPALVTRLCRLNCVPFKSSTPELTNGKLKFGLYPYALTAWSVPAVN